MVWRLTYILFASSSWESCSCIRWFLICSDISIFILIDSCISFSFDCLYSLPFFDTVVSLCFLLIWWDITWTMSSCQINGYSVYRKSFAVIKNRGFYMSKVFDMLQRPIFCTWLLLSSMKPVQILNISLFVQMKIRIFQIKPDIHLFVKSHLIFAYCWMIRRFFLSEFWILEIFPL